MKIQLNTDNHIPGNEGLLVRVEAVVNGALDRFRDQISRVEVHLSDENSNKGGPDDKRCLMEARIEGRTPMAVSHHAGDLDQAIEGAAGKLERAVASTFDRLRSH